MCQIQQCNNETIILCCSSVKGSCRLFGKLLSNFQDDYCVGEGGIASPFPAMTAPPHFRCVAKRQIQSDPVERRRPWEGWRVEIQAAICTRGPALEGPNTSRSASTGTRTLPGGESTRKPSALLRRRQK